MLACRPDYLLYPEKNTIAERSEYIRLLDDQLNLLPLTQDYTNSFKNKATYISDRYLWLADKKVLCSALERVKDVKNLCFLHPIRIDLIIHDKDVRDRFLTLKLSRRSKIT